MSAARRVGRAAASTARQPPRAKPPEDKPIGLIVLHRHGERAPAINVWSGDPHRAENEKELWESLMPPPQVLDQLDRDIPVRSSAIKLPKDQSLWPFGSLTHRGLKRMVAIGEGIRFMFDPVISSTSKVDFRICSTNFKRTQQSSQSLLKGMRVANLHHGEDELHVLVREEGVCTIHQYDTKFREIKAAMEPVLRSKEFKQRTADHDVQALTKELAATFPALNTEAFKWYRCLQVLFALIVVTVGLSHQHLAILRQPCNRVNDVRTICRMDAADYFWCRQAAGIQLPPKLLRLARPTMDFMSWRFGQYFRDKTVLRLVIAPLLDEIIERLKEMVAKDMGAGHEGISRVAMFSGHDVQLLAVLHALRSPLLREASFWPPFGSALLIELLRPDPQSQSQSYRIHVRMSMGLDDHGYLKVENVGWASRARTIEELVARIEEDGVLPVLSDDRLDEVAVSQSE